MEFPFATREHWNVRTADDARQRLAELDHLEELCGCTDDWTPQRKPPEWPEDEQEGDAFRRQWIENNRTKFHIATGISWSARDDVRTKLRLIAGDFLRADDVAISA